MKRILITGPESTGKSELAEALTLHYGGICIPEYAREYIQKLDRPYEYKDLEQIARKQIEEYTHAHHALWVFFDTWLVITKVWFDLVYGASPQWLTDNIRNSVFDLVLLCDIDIPWVPDPVRENGGAMRKKLLNTYKRELDAFQLEWELVSGVGEERIHCATQLITNRIGYAKP